MKRSEADLAIIGGGIIGLFCAYYLSKGGKSVVVEKGEEKDMCFCGNCGLVRPSHALPLNRPELILKAVVWLFLWGTNFFSIDKKYQRQSHWAGHGNHRLARCGKQSSSLRYQASFRVESLALKDVYVEFFAHVLDAKDFPFDIQGGLHVAMRIINHGLETLPVIRPLICNQFRDLIGFSQRYHDFKYNYFMVDDQIIATADLPTKDMNTTFKGCVVKGVLQRDMRAEKNEGLIEKDMDMALSVATSIDHERKVIFWWILMKSMIANARITCIHADPYFGTLKPGEEAYAEGLILFSEREIKPIVKFLKNKRLTSFLNKHKHSFNNQLSIN